MRRLVIRPGFSTLIDENSEFGTYNGRLSKVLILVIRQPISATDVYKRQGESDASVMAQIMSVVPQLEKGLTREELQKILPAGAARNALDCAL